MDLLSCRLYNGDSAKQNARLAEGGTTAVNYSEIEQERDALRKALKTLCAATETARTILDAAAARLDADAELKGWVAAARPLLDSALAKAHDALMHPLGKPLAEQDGLLTRELSGGRILACDGKCHKAFSFDSRPRVQVGPESDPNDFAYLADDEVGEAPPDNGRPQAPEQRLGRWCYRECERSVIVQVGEPVALPDFSRRRYNIPASDPQNQGGK